MAFSEGRRPMPRPLVTLRTADRPQLSGGGKLYRALADGKTQTAEFVAPPLPEGRGRHPHAAEEPGTLVVRLTGGMGRGKTPEPGSVPEPDDTVCWTLFEHAPRGGPELPDPEDTPWTHGGPPSGAADGGPHPAPDPVTAEDFL